MKKALFISEDLRTLQKKNKCTKASENLVARTGNGKFSETIKFPMKKSEKLQAEKKSEKLIAEKKSEKLQAEKSLETIKVPTDILQQMFGVNTKSVDKDRLF